jgi:hypothetical protein
MLVERPGRQDVKPFIFVRTARLRLREAAHDLLEAMVTRIGAESPLERSSFLQLIRIRPLGGHAEPVPATAQV